MFQDADYIRWANEETVHLLSYALDPAASAPEPVRDADRDGVPTSVLVAYPMFTPDEAKELAEDVDRHVKFPMHTPWVGVLAADGATVLASGTKGTSATYRALYDAERRKLGPALPRATWLEVVRRLDASAEAELDERFAAAVDDAVAARDLAPKPSPALAERLEARLEALRGAARAALERAERVVDREARAAAVAKARADFARLPAAAR